MPLPDDSLHTGAEVTTTVNNKVKKDGKKPKDSEFSDEDGGDEEDGDMEDMYGNTAEDTTGMKKVGK